MRCTHPVRAVIALVAIGLVSIAAAETPEDRLAAAGYTLPEPPSPVATYVTSRRAGNLLFLSGHGECGDDFTTGMASLPSNIAVEIEAIVELHEK